ncbi:MAG: TetR/AcrR family transcriptional regulator [Pseudomonadota bacterium]
MEQSGPKPDGLAEYRARVVAEKRAAAMDAAIDLFLTNGYDHTTLEQVAKSAGISSATVYKHFPTKAALFGGIMSRLWENEPEHLPAMPAPGNPRQGLLAVGRAYASLLLRDQTVALFRVVTAEAPRFPELGQELYERGKKPYLDRLRIYLEREISAGTLKINDIPLAKRQFLGMINDVVFWPRLLIVNLKISKKDADIVVREAVETFLRRYSRRKN